MPIRLVEVTREILPQIRSIDQSCLGGLWSLESYQQEIDNPHSYLLAAITEDRIVLGFACLWSVLEEAHITILAVRPEYHRQGLGRYLVWGLLKQAHLRGLEWATLEVRASNIAAIELYKKFGFTIIGSRRGYYQVTGEDALIMWLKGLHHPEFAQTLENWGQEIRQNPYILDIAGLSNS